MKEFKVYTSSEGADSFRKAVEELIRKSPELNIKLTESAEPNRNFKVVGRCPSSKRLLKKKVYTSKVDFDKYSPDLIRRWGYNMIIETHEMINSKWVMIK